jgi:hypothetical protein
MGVSLRRVGAANRLNGAAWMSARTASWEVARLDRIPLRHRSGQTRPTASLSPRQSCANACENGRGSRWSVCKSSGRLVATGGPLRGGRSPGAPGRRTSSNEIGE